MKISSTLFSCLGKDLMSKAVNNSLDSHLHVLPRILLQNSTMQWAAAASQQHGGDR
jgi:hypothetical protein